MDLILRPVRGISTARFSNDGSRLVTLDHYVTGWDVTRLQRLFRVRPLEQLRSLTFQPGGDLMISSHADGALALMDARSGALLKTCGEKRFNQDSALALSRCGNFVIECRWQEWCVREISSNTVVWKHAGNVRCLLPVDRGREWAVFHDNELQVWRWPFSQAPERIIPLQEPLLGIPAIRGTLVAIPSYREISVLHLIDGAPVFSVPLGQLGSAYWVHGSLTVIKNGDRVLEVYSHGGDPFCRVGMPDLSWCGHAFNEQTDHAALVYHEGLALVRDFRRLFNAGGEIAAPWTPREPREYRSQYRPVRLPEPTEHTVLECSTPQQLETALQKFRRTAWKPQLRAERGPIDSSKMGGVPWLAEAEEWPRCGQCDSCMDLFLQLNSTDLPAESGSLFEGLLQVFVCTHTTYRSGLCASQDPFSNAASVRILRERSGMPRYAEPPDDSLFEEQRIVGWTRHDDFPQFDELALTGLELDERGRTLQIDQEFPFPVQGDKLLGWADWEQGVELVACPRCGEAMRILFQIDSCCGVPVMLADDGRGWVSQCRQHPDVVTFSWTCG